MCMLSVGSSCGLWLKTKLLSTIAFKAGSEQRSRRLTSLHRQDLPFSAWLPDTGLWLPQALTAALAPAHAC